MRLKVLLNLRGLSCLIGTGRCASENSWVSTEAIFAPGSASGPYSAPTPPGKGPEPRSLPGGEGSAGPVGPVRAGGERKGRDKKEGTDVSVCRAQQRLPAPIWNSKGLSGRVRRDGADGPLHMYPPRGSPPPPFPLPSSLPSPVSLTTSTAHS